jgi:hypothetical protein
MLRGGAATGRKTTPTGLFDRTKSWVSSFGLNPGLFTSITKAGGLQGASFTVIETGTTFQNGAGLIVTPGQTVAFGDVGALPDPGNPA